MPFSFWLTGYPFQNPFIYFLISKSTNLPCSTVSNVLTRQEILLFCLQKSLHLFNKKPQSTPPSCQRNKKKDNQKLVCHDLLFHLISFQLFFPCKFIQEYYLLLAKHQQHGTSVLALASANFHLATSSAIWCHHMNHTYAI